MSRIWPLGLYRVDGDSMRPALRPGQLLVGRRWFARVRPGQIVVAAQAGRPVVKRAARVEADRVWLAGDNAAASTDSRHHGPVERAAVEAVIIRKDKSMRPRRDTGSTILACFSPPVMIATFLVEIGTALYLAWRYRLGSVVRLTVALLALLAIFQLAEFMVCQGADGPLWARVGFVAITLLPPLGVHLELAVARLRRRPLILAAYATALAFAAAFLTLADPITGRVCLGNYVIFLVDHRIGGLYGVYYYAWLLAGTAVGIWAYRRTKASKTRRALAALIAGYAALLLPTATINLMSPATVRGIPSIMCGFAVILALLAGLVTAPLSAVRRGRR